VHAYDDPTQPVELGGSIFVKVNHILVDAVRRFNLPTHGFDSSNVPASTPELGVWNGKEFVFVAPADPSLWDTAKLLWRYGLAPIKTTRLMKSTIASFLKLYDPPFFPWSDLTEVSQAVGLTPDFTGVTGEQLLKQNGIGDLFAKEVIQAR
jgi:prenylcysteine oxidase / farnesylcysteine lyase